MERLLSLYRNFGMRDEHPDNKALLGQVAAVHGHRSDAELASLPGIAQCRPLGVVRPQGFRSDACTEQFRSDATQGIRPRGGASYYMHPQGPLDN